jgi:hypothetical protein
MWRNKKWAMVIVLAVVVIMAVGVIGGVVYAQSGTTPTPNNPRDTLMSRVAKNLNIDQATLEAAFTKAEKEMGQEAFTNRLKQLVDSGKITQEQADQYQEWWTSRPDVPAGLDAQPKFAPRGPMGFKGGPRCFPGQGRFPAPPAPNAAGSN